MDEVQFAVTLSCSIQLSLYHVLKWTVLFIEVGQILICGRFAMICNRPQRGSESSGQDNHAGARLRRHPRLALHRGQIVEAAIEAGGQAERLLAVDRRAGEARGGVR